MSRTCVVAIVWFFVISDFPEDAKWLSEQERSYIRARLQADVGKAAVERPTNFGDIVTFFKDYKVILGWLMYLGLIVPAYGYAYFSPTIIKTYGYSNIQSASLLRLLACTMLKFTYSTITFRAPVGSCLGDGPYSRLCIRYSQT